MAEGRPARPRPDRARLPGHRAGRQGGPPGDRRGAAGAAPRAARPGRDRLAEPVPARVAGEPRRDEGGAELHPGAARGEHARGWWRCRAAGTGSWPGGCGPATAKGRGRSASGTRGCSAAGDGPAAERVRPGALPPPAARTTTGSPRRPRAWPWSWGCRWSSRTTSTTRCREDRELQDVLTAIRHGRTLGGPGGPAPAGRGVVPQGCAELLALPPGDDGDGRCRSRPGAGLAGGDRGLGGDRGRVQGGARLRALPLPGLPGAARGDAVQPPVGAVLGGRPAPLPPAHAGGGAAARPRAGRHRDDRARGVLPHLLGPDAVREVARDPGPGARERGGLDRGLRPGDHPGGPDPPRAAVRAVHQRGPDGVPGRGHRLQLASGGRR